MSLHSFCTGRKNGLRQDTYLIAYELNIDTVTYNVWNDENYSFPWYGSIMYPHYEMTVASPNELIIYRIPRVAIWNE